MLWGKGLPPLPRLDGGNDLHRSEEVPFQERKRMKTEALSRRGDGGGGPSAASSGIAAAKSCSEGGLPGGLPVVPTPSYRPATREGR
jgi:hypothetical protein